jgi:hypothetical protein
VADTGVHPTNARQDGCCDAEAAGPHVTRLTKPRLWTSARRREMSLDSNCSRYWLGGSSVAGPAAERTEEGC